MGLNAVRGSESALSTDRPREVAAGGRWLRRLLIAAIAVPVVLGIASVGVMWLEGDAPAPDVKAPLFSLVDQDGRTHHLADYRERSVALCFYGPLDAAAKTGLRSVAKDMREFDIGNLRLFAVGGGDDSARKTFHDAEKIPFPLLNDAGGATAAAYALKGEGRGIVIVGPDGRILGKLDKLQPERMGEQVATLAMCCLMPSRQKLIRALGKPLPDTKLPLANEGRPESIYGNTARPKATVAVFLSSHCPCSKGYDERVRELAQSYSPRDVRVIAVFSSADESPADIAAHARTAGFTFPVFHDPGNKLADILESRVTPEAYVMDRGGIVRYHGRIDDSRVAEDVRSHDLRNAIDAVLSGHVPPRADVPAFGCAISRVENAAR